MATPFTHANAVALQAQSCPLVGAQVDVVAKVCTRGLDDTKQPTTRSLQLLSTMVATPPTLTWKRSCKFMDHFVAPLGSFLSHRNGCNSSAGFKHLLYRACLYTSQTLVQYTRQTQVQACVHVAPSRYSHCCLCYCRRAAFVSALGDFLRVTMLLSLSSIVGPC